MIKAEKVKIPLAYLPKDYRAIGAKKFNKSEKLISLVVNGWSRNDEIFDYFLDIAVKRKEKIDNGLAILTKQP